MGAAECVSEREAPRFPPISLFLRPEAHPEVASSPPRQMSLPNHLRLRAWSPDPRRNNYSPAWAPWARSATAVIDTDPEGWAFTFIGLPGGGHTVEVVSPRKGRGAWTSPHRGPGEQGGTDPELETHLPGLPLPAPFQSSSPSPSAPTHLVHFIIPELWRPQQGRSARAGGGYQSAGDKRWGRTAVPQSRCPAPA